MQRSHSDHKRDRGFFAAVPSEKVFCLQFPFQPNFPRSIFVQGTRETVCGVEVIVVFATRRRPALLRFRHIVGGFVVVVVLPPLLLLLLFGSTTGVIIVVITAIIAAPLLTPVAVSL